MKNKKVYIKIGLVVLSAVLSNFAYPEYDLFWIHFFSLIPFLYVLINEKKIINCLWYGALWGMVFNGILLFWLKIFHPLSLPGILIGIFVYFALLGFLTKYLINTFPRLKIFIIPAVWTLIEYIRSIGFLGFPWGLISHSQWNFLPFIQIADIFGMWIISFLVVFVNSILLEIILRLRTGKKIKVFLTGLAIVLLFPLLYGIIKIQYWKNSINKSEELKIGLIQSHIDPNLPWKKVKYQALSRLTILSLRANLYNPDLISWSETAILDYIKYYKDNFSKLKKYPHFYEKLNYANNVFRLAKDLDNYIFTGIPDYEKVTEGGKTIDADYNGAVLINPHGKIVDTYHKIHLVPFGEWFPYKIPFINKILTQTWAGSWTPGKKFTVFEFFKNDIQYQFSCLICYEGVFGDLCRKFILKGAEFLLNITNDTWSFTRKAELQHMIADVYRSIENRVPYVRCANSGVTCVINQYGKVTSILPLFKEGYLIGRIHIDKNRLVTFYTLYGDYFPKFLLIFNLVLLLYSLYLNIYQVVLKIKK